VSVFLYFRPTGRNFVDGYAIHKGHCYKLVSEEGPKNFYDAQRHCMSIGWNLAGWNVPYSLRQFENAVGINFVITNILISGTFQSKISQT